MHLTSRNRRRSAASALSVLAGAALLLSVSACAPDTSAGGDLTTGDSYETSMVDWQLKRDDCMKKAGFDISAPETAPGEPVPPLDISQFDMVAFDKAYATCISEIGDAPVDPNMPTEEQIFEAQLVFAACMRAAGYDYADPVEGSGGMSAALGPEVDGQVVDACSDKAYADWSAQ